MSEISVPTEGHNERLTRDTWIQEGLLALTEHGEPAIRVDVIARKLKITRGSFYYHFEGRAEFLSAILKEWHQSTTTLIHEYLAKSSLTPAEQFNYLLDLTTSGDQRAAGGRVEQAVSQWATYSVDAARALKSVHQERLEFTTALLKQLGFKSPAVTAEILYSYVVGHNSLAEHLSVESSVHRAALLEMLGLSKKLEASKTKHGRRR